MRAQTCQLQEASREGSANLSDLPKKWGYCFSALFGFGAVYHPLHPPPPPRALAGQVSFEVVCFKAEASVSLSSLRLKSFCERKKPGQ